MSEPPAHHLARSVAETEAVAAALAPALRPGMCVALHGDLGAGKTQFVRGIVRALGGSPRAVSSPTYVLLNGYEIPAGAIRTVYHLDAYRVQGPADFEAIGFAELLEQPDAIVLVEWAEKVAPLLPRDAIHVTLRPADEMESARVIDIVFPPWPGRQVFQGCL